MHETNNTDRSGLVSLAAVIDLGDRIVYEERLVPAEAAEAIENGDQIVAWTDLELVVRYELEEAREHLARLTEVTRDRIAALLARRDQIEARHPELRRRRGG